MMIFTEPMLLGKRTAPFVDDDYIHEVKFDGHRLLLSHKDGVTRLFTRHQTDYTLQYPELMDVPTDDDILVDGEVVCIPAGASDFEFEAVQERFQMKNSVRIAFAAKRQPVAAIIWDILWLNGHDLRRLPLMERKRLLDQTLGENAFIRKMPYVEGDGISLFEAVKAHGWEGICSKPRRSLYIPGERGRKVWHKIINYQYTRVYLSGFLKKELGWISLIPKEDGSFVPGGVIELATRKDQRQEFYRRSRALIVKENQDVVFIRPEIQAIVRHRGWTRKGLLRLPEFVQFCS